MDDGYAGYWQSFCATIWPWKTKDAVFQYNEAFDTVGEGNGDGQAWDIDWSDGTVTSITIVIIMVEVLC